jgi:hypothetical protein
MVQATLFSQMRKNHDLFYAQPDTSLQEPNVVEGLCSWVGNALVACGGDYSQPLEVENVRKFREAIVLRYALGRRFREICVGKLCS